MYDDDEFTPWEELQHYYNRVQQLEATETELVRALQNHQQNIQSLIQQVQRLNEANRRMAQDQKALKQYVTTHLRQPQNTGK